MGKTQGTGEIVRRNYL